MRREKLTEEDLGNIPPLPQLSSLLPSVGRNRIYHALRGRKQQIENCRPDQRHGEAKEDHPPGCWFVLILVDSAANVEVLQG